MAVRVVIPYLPDRSRLARGVISGETARLSNMFFFSFYYTGGCQVLVREKHDTIAAAPNNKVSDETFDLTDARKQTVK